jgi:hypothetical protein
MNKRIEKLDGGGRGESDRETHRRQVSLEKK